MAMRSQSFNRKRQPISRPTYESFKPKSEWIQEKTSSVLAVYLPGFLLEQIRINWDPFTQLIRIHGQRSIPVNRWIRFDESFKCPNSCDINKILTQFERGILFLVLPKIVTTNPTTTPQTSQEFSKPKEENTFSKVSSNSSIEANNSIRTSISSSPPKSVQEESKSSNSKINETLKTAQNVINNEPILQNGQKVTPPKSTPTTLKSDVTVEIPQKNITDPKPQKDQEISPPQKIANSNIEDLSSISSITKPKAHNDKNSSLNKIVPNIKFEALSPPKYNEPRIQKGQEINSNQSNSSSLEIDKGVEISQKNISQSKSEKDEDMYLNSKFEALNHQEVDKPKYQKDQEITPQKSIPSSLEIIRPTGEPSFQKGQEVSPKKPRESAKFERMNLPKPYEPRHRTGQEVSSQNASEVKNDKKSKEKAKHDCGDGMNQEKEGMSGEEDAKSLVNLAAATLVIMGLGSYWFRSIGLFGA